ncbi:hypothetical protein CDD83_6724 [Cordyceps sp. RAO-2017]|nr:hypothetical protein CDD83_6724 [Cordyceps sp. RAO-2017]
MRSSAFLGLLATYVLGAGAAQSLSGYVKDVPECAYAAFAKAMSEEGCKIKGVDADDLECLCKHMSSISIGVSREVETRCAANFGQAIGSACGMWRAHGTTATDLPAATSLLAKELAGQTPGSSSATATATATESKSKNFAAAATPAPGLVGLVGGAAAAAFVGILV